MTLPESTSSDTFFLQAPLGLELICQKEISRHFPSQLYRGGVEVQCSWQDGLAINYWCKTPTRVLWRVAHFRAKDFPALKSKLQKLRWREFVERGEVRFHASSHNSRLKIKSRIEETAASAYSAFHKGHEPKASCSTKPIDVYIRIVDDQVTVSVDTSGDPLYQRGDKKFTVPAPLRENMAACLIRETLKHAPAKSEFFWIDPMAGSGTFILEAATKHQLNDRRTFAFENFPVATQQILQIKLRAQQLLQPTNTKESFFAFDKSEKALVALNENLKTLNATVAQVDLFDSAINSQVNKSSDATCKIVLMNPPFGERLEITQSPKEFFAECIAATVFKFNPNTIGILMLSKFEPIKPPANYRLVERLHFQHGGLPVSWLIFKL